MQITKVIQAAVLLLTLGMLTACNEENIKAGERLGGDKLSQIEADNKAKEGILLIDVRDAKEYSKAHIKHAINIPLENLSKNLNILSDYKDKDIVLYCNSGNKSGKALKLLKENGFNKVVDAVGVKEYKYETFTPTNLTAKQFLDLKSKDNDILFFDLRDEKDYKQSHMQGAINANVKDSVEKYKDILEANKGKKIVTYCYSGNRSFSFANELKKAGYDEVYNLIDGTKEYNYELIN